MRNRRLQAELQKLMQLNDMSDLIQVEPVRGQLDRYAVTFNCRGLMWPEGAAGPAITARHQCEIYLHLDFPRKPPQIKWLTEIFHPNILPPRQNGGVCIGSWTPAETLDHLVVRLFEMVQMKNYSVHDALDLRAAAWAKQHIAQFPLDNRHAHRAEDVFEIELA